MPLKEMGDNAVLVWYCRVDNLSYIGELGHSFVSYINQSGEPATAIVVNLKEWEAMRIEWSCPASQRTFNSQRDMFNNPQGWAIRPMVVAPHVPDSLLVVRAKAFFWKFNKSSLDKIAQECQPQVVIPSGATLFETLLTLTKSILRPLYIDKDVMDVLATTLDVKGY